MVALEPNGKTGSGRSLRPLEYDILGGPDSSAPVLRAAEAALPL